MRKSLFVFMFVALMISISVSKSNIIFSNNMVASDDSDRSDYIENFTNYAKNRMSLAEYDNFSFLKKSGTLLPPFRLIAF